MSDKYFKFKDIDFLTTNSFTPNLTSDLIFSSSRNFISEGIDVLDLGCGSGAVGLALLNQLKNFNLTLSDLSNDALKDASYNAKKINANVTVIQSDIFENINCKYDLIINDISGISESVAKISEWFLNAPCNSGIDGLDLFEKVFEGSLNALKDNGVMIFPILSLSNTERAINIVNKFYTSYTSLVKKEWFLPDSILENNYDLLQNLKDDGHISYQSKFGKIVVYTEVLFIKKNDSVLTGD